MAEFVIMELLFVKFRLLFSVFAFGALNNVL